MDIMDFAPIRARLKVDGAASTTAIAAAANSRWVITAFALGWSNAINSCTISLYEIDSTNSAPFFVMQTSATSGFYSAFLGPVGIMQSSSYSSRMVLNTGQTGTWSAMFTGYWVGGQ